MSLVTVTAPTAEPIDLADAKAHMRIGFATDDALVSAWISAARDYAENMTRKQLVAARYKQVMDAFPSSSFAGTPYNTPNSRPANAIYLERGPVNNVVSVNYLDMSNTPQVMPSANYIVDYSTDPVRITPVFGQIWPIPQPQIGAVWVIFDTGYCAPFTASGNNLTVSGWPALTVNTVVRVSNSGGALPTPLKAKTDYFIQSAPGNGVYTLSATSGGAVITLTDTGIGTNYLFETPPGLIAWLKLRLASMYENREELDASGSIAGLPYADRLLDGYKTYEF